MAFIPAQHIENEAIAVLQAFERKSERALSCPIQIEDLLEIVYEIIPEAGDLRGKFHSDDVLAESTVYRDGTIKIGVDESIYPYYHQEKENRYRFTLGHEVGHICLHLPEVLARLKADDLWADNEPKQFSVYRSSCKEPKEKQSDMFSGFLLMPKQLILAEWEKKFGPDHGPENVFDEMRELTKDTLYPDSVRPTIVKEFAAIFNVSAESMQYRLEALKLVEFGEPQPSLF